MNSPSLDIRPAIISLRDVSLQRDGRSILSHVDLAVRERDFVAVTGPNGGGKTTLLRIILKLIKPSSGSVYVHPAMRIGYLPQKNMIDSHFPISVYDVVASGLLASRNLTKAEKRDLVARTISRIGLDDRAAQPIGTLSGGQLQRTLLGRAIISNPSLLVLDEPLSYLDKHFEQRLYDIISEISRTATIVLVSHEMSQIAGMATRHLIVDRTIHECTAAHHYIPSECE